MSKNKASMDLISQFQGLTIIHQKIPGHEVGRHSHDEHELFMPLQGEITIQYDNKVVKAGPGRMLYVPPELDHRFSSTAQGSGERVIVLISDMLWERINKKMGNQHFPPTSFNSSGLAKELLFYLLVESKVDGLKYFINTLIETLINTIQGESLQSSKNLNILSGKANDQRIRLAIDEIVKSKGRLSIANVAQKSGLSVRNFNRLFLKEIGFNPKDYVIQIRINLARDLLKKTQMTVTDIAFEVGYNSLSKFIETFKKYEGVLPSDYRQSNS